MANRKTRSASSRYNFDSTMDFEDHELQETMRDFLEEEKKANTNIWNFATIAGIAMIFVGMWYLVQTLITGLGPDLSGLINATPMIGGILVTLVGFGYLVGDRKKKRKEKKKKKSTHSSRNYNFDFDQQEEEDFTLDNDLGSRRSKSQETKTGEYDHYAFRQTKKLYKSRTSKKMAGVCGGLARYFGISATVVRLLFVITFFAGSGTSLIVYIALAIVLDKEPPEVSEEFDY